MQTDAIVAFDLGNSGHDRAGVVIIIIINIIKFKKLQWVQQPQADLGLLNRTRWFGETLHLNCL